MLCLLTRARNLTASAMSCCSRGLIVMDSGALPWGGFEAFFVAGNRGLWLAGKSHCSSTFTLGCPKDLSSGQSFSACLLMMVSLNQQPVSLTRSEVMLYTDDTTIYLSDSNTLSLKERLSQDLVALSTWIANNGLTMNTQKTQLMVIFKRGRDKEVEKLQIKINASRLGKYVASGCIYRLWTSLPYYIYNIYLVYYIPYYKYNM